MSWAQIAKQNAPPISEQPQPSQDLLEGGHFEGETSAQHGFSDSKVTVVDRETFEHPENVEVTKAESVEPLNLSSNPHPNDPLNYEPATSSSAPDYTDAPAGSEIKVPSAKEIEAKAEKKVDQAAASTKKAARQVEKKAEQVEAKVEDVAKDVKAKGKELASEAEKKTKQVANDVEKKSKQLATDAERAAKKLERKAAAEIERAENAVGYYYNQTKELVLRPGALGGLMGVANVGLLSTIGYFAYTRRNVAWDRNYVGATAASVLTLFGIEGVVAEKFANTPEGEAEIARAKAEGSKVYLNARELILRPGVAGGLLGAVNVAVLGAVGYLGYQNWDRRVWDRKIIAGIASGLVSLSAVEGLAANVWKQKKEGRA